MPSPRDILGRPLRNLRVSVTDRCNLRCAYCMPEEEYAWLPKARILRYEELTRLVRALVPLGVERVRLTGGEPLLRRDLDQLVAQLRTIQGLREVTLTTNGVELVRSAAALAAAGLSRITVSLDTLREDRYRELCRRDGLEQVRAGVAAARAAGLTVKLNTVVMRGVNDDELLDLFAYAQGEGAELRLIEYMDVGGATRWDSAAVVPQDELLSVLDAAHGPLAAEPGDPAAPANRYLTADGTRFGVIASTTAPFCASCDRARLTADGRLYTCLYGREGLDLAQTLRSGADATALRARVTDAWSARDDRGAEERLGLHERRRPLADKGELDDDPHLEMHTRGG